MNRVHLDFLVIGAQKAGSTYLVQALRAHPDIFLPAEEIPCFEDPNYERGGIAKLQHSLEGAQESQRRGVKRASWLARPECPARIADHCPDARLIVILRNPVDRAVSSLFNLMHAAKLPLAPTEQAIDGLLDETLQNRYPAAAIVLSYGLYAEHLTRYLKYFKREQMLIVLLEDVRDDAAAVHKSLYEFVGVDGASHYSRADHRPMATPYSYTRLRIQRALRPLHTKLWDSGLRRKPRRGPLAPLVRRAAGGLDRFVMAPLFPGRRPVLSAELRRRLNAYYASDVEALSSLLDRDLSHWLEQSP